MIPVQRFFSAICRVPRWSRAVAILTFASGWSPLPAEEEKSIASVAKSYFEKAVEAAKSIVTGEEAEEASTDPAVDPEQLALDAALTAAKSEIFLTDGIYDFTQSRWGAKPTPYQIEGLEMVLLTETAPLTAGDEAAGIDQRLTYEFRAKTHRRFHEQTGWGRWMEGVPPHLDGITLVREKGVWKVASSPVWAYSLK